MKKLILASVSAIALFGIAACSESSDKTTTQSTTPPPANEQAKPPAATAPAAPAPSTGTEGNMQQKPAAPAQ